jgi:hypothetical protein
MIRHHQAADRSAVHESVGPWTVDALVSDVHRHATAGRWLWATAAVCFLQELLFCIDDGGVEVSRHVSSSFFDEVRTLRYLRNVIREAGGGSRCEPRLTSPACAGGAAGRRARRGSS